MCLRRYLYLTRMILPLEGVLNKYDPKKVRSPIATDSYFVHSFSFRDMLLELVKVAELSDGGMPIGWTKEKSKLVVEEIKNLQDFGMINLDAGDGTTITSFVRDPFGADPAAYADASTAKFEERKQAAIEGGADPRRFYSSAEYRAKAFQSHQRYRDSYVRNPAEFAVDPIWVYLVDPKLAKETMPNTTEFIRLILNDATFSKDTVKFYSSPIATMVAAALAILAANGGEEPEEQPMTPGALSPQGQGALSII